MDTLDPAGEFLRISDHYRQMSDSELLVLLRQSFKLTPLAQQALATEVRSRGLKSEPEEKKSSSASRFEPPVFVERNSEARRNSTGSDSSDADSLHEDEYAEDRKLIDLCTVWSERDALQVQSILDVAGIPFFIGPEKATGVDEVTSDFSNGVAVQVMRIGLPWAGHALRRDYIPKDDRTPKEEEPDELPVRCPKCHSEEVVFDGLAPTSSDATNESSQKFRWTCDSCLHQWEDDGVAKDE
ncbi:MAG: hypothetical protein WCB11_13865 [Terriglobales bacterium]